MDEKDWQDLMWNPSFTMKENKGGGQSLPISFL